MTAVWPATLPQSPLADSYSEAGERNVIRFEVDAGPAEMRRRHTRGLRQIGATYWLTSAQLATWRGFWADDLSHGAMWFEWPDPVIGEAILARVIDPPMITPVAGGQRWQMALRIEARVDALPEEVEI